MERVKDELHEVKEEQTQIEGKVKDIKIELVECLETRCKGQDNLLREQRERMRSLEVDSDQVSPVKVKLCEVERAHDAKGYMPSFGGVEAPGSLGLTQAPGMIVPECVQSTSNMAWMSARESAGHASTQTGIAVSVTDGRGEPLKRDKVILETTPAPRDSACEVRECARSALCKLRKRGSLHEVLMALEEPASKLSVPGKLPERGRLKGE